MSSFRNHRVIIASLFLPTTVAFGESGLSDQSVSESGSLSSQTSGVASERPAFHQRLSGSVPLKSIVDDLKVCTVASRAWTLGHMFLQTRAIAPLASPKSDIPTPFTKFVNIASPQPGATPRAVSTPSSASSSDSESKSSPPLPSLDRAFTLFRARKFQTAHQDVQHCARLQRKQSRSTSRRSASLASNTDSERGHRHWHISPNTHCNGGLKNAIDSVKARLTQKLWVGTLGSSTDSFGSEMRKSIDKKMRQVSDSVPVWIPDGEFESCYDEFCHQVGTC